MTNSNSNPKPTFIWQGQEIAINVEKLKALWPIVKKRKVKPRIKRKNNA